MRDRLVARAQATSLAHWAMYLGAKIFCTLLQGGQKADLKAYDIWYERLDQLCITSNNDETLVDFSRRLTGALEVRVLITVATVHLFLNRTSQQLSYLKFITSNTNAGYTQLRNIAPAFLRVAFADPNLWPREPGSSGISLVHVFATSNPDVGRFAVTDSILSLSLGVPPLIEYDTSSPISELSPSYLQRAESIQGCAASVAISIIKVNIWRAYNHNPPAKHSWQEIEADILAWKTQPEDSPSDDSWEAVARLAIKEGWRHAGLIYLYMVRSLKRTSGFIG